jgi:hypothetical protein
MSALELCNNAARKHDCIGQDSQQIGSLTRIANDVQGECGSLLDDLADVLLFTWL